jgi:hypothetical protein
MSEIAAYISLAAAEPRLGNVSMDRGYLVAQYPCVTHAPQHLITEIRVASIEKVAVTGRWCDVFRCRRKNRVRNVTTRRLSARNSR